LCVDQTQIVFRILTQWRALRQLCVSNPFACARYRSRKEKGSLRCLLIFTLDEVPSSGGFGACVVLAAELLDAARGVHDLLCAGVERVTFGTDFDVQFRFAHGGAGLEFVAAAACHCDLFVFRVNGGFHFVFLAKVGRGICTRTDTD
jgi:hypothetical protein